MACAVRTDGQGRIYVAGGSGKAFVEARDPDGNVLWEAAWGEEEPDVSACRELLELDSSGRLSVGGHTFQMETLPDSVRLAAQAIFAVYSSDGRELWAARRESPGDPSRPLGLPARLVEFRRIGRLPRDRL